MKRVERNWVTCDGAALTSLLTTPPEGGRMEREAALLALTIKENRARVYACDSFTAHLRLQFGNERALIYYGVACRRRYILNIRP